MNVRWTQTARGHLRAIRAYIAQDSPKHAAGMGESFMRKVRVVRTVAAMCSTAKRRVCYNLIMARVPGTSYLSCPPPKSKRIRLPAAQPFHRFPPASQGYSPPPCKPRQLLYGEIYPKKGDPSMFVHLHPVNLWCRNLACFLHPSVSVRVRPCLSSCQLLSKNGDWQREVRAVPVPTFAAFHRLRGRQNLMMNCPCFPRNHNI